MAHTLSVLIAVVAIAAVVAQAAFASAGEMRGRYQLRLGEATQLVTPPAKP
jgi:hypothetical protein